MTDKATSDDAASSKPDHRTRRACEETMAISLVRRGGIYEVQSASGNDYEVDIGMGTCSCLDWQTHEPDGGCKHVRRVDMEIKDGRVPRPDGRLPERDSGTRTEPEPSSPTSTVATDGGALANTDENRFTACMRRIEGRARDLDLEIDQRRAELKDLECTLSVIEEFLPDDHPSEDVEVSTDEPNSRSLHETPAD